MGEIKNILSRSIRVLWLSETPNKFNNMVFISGRLNQYIYIYFPIVKQEIKTGKIVCNWIFITKSVLKMDEKRYFKWPKKSLVWLSSFIYCLLFYTGFTLGYITFYNFLKLYSALLEKKFFCNKIFISNGFTQTPHPLNGHNPQSMMKFFCQRYLNYDH